MSSLNPACFENIITLDTEFSRPTTLLLSAWTIRAELALLRSSKNKCLHPPSVLSQRVSNAHFSSYTYFSFWARFTQCGQSYFDEQPARYSLFCFDGSNHNSDRAEGTNDCIQMQTKEIFRDRERTMSVVEGGAWLCLAASVVIYLYVRTYCHNSKWTDFLKKNLGLLSFNNVYFGNFTSL